MAKEKTLFICAECGHQATRWYGRCPQCDAWNTMDEVLQETDVVTKPRKQPAGTGHQAVAIQDIDADGQERIRTGLPEFDRVLGGGLVAGSLLLVGGEPGVGKSTLLLQIGALLAAGKQKVLYISGEESARQVRLRAQRLGVGKSDMLFLAENAMDAIDAQLSQLSPDYCIVDSIQTLYRPDLASAPGSVSQVRECAAGLMRYAKASGCTILMVGHVTKEGAIAGPRVLEHMVDVVLYFEGDFQREYRMLRAVKNRFGSVNEMGLFEMTGEGMVPVEGASEAMLALRAQGVSGSIVFCAMEGSRPILVDVQALAAASYYPSPKRTVNGMDAARVALLLAVLEKRVGLKLYQQDVYINIAGGLSLSEPAADLPMCLAVASSMADKGFAPDVAAFGEVGLGGELRSVPHTERRLQECLRMGFKRVIMPKARRKSIKAPEGLQILTAETVAEALVIANKLAQANK